MNSKIEDTNSKYVLGISAYYHDSSATLLKDGNLICAVQEERFTRIKHESSFPSNSIKFILKETNLSLSQIDYIVFYDNPFLKFQRLISTYISNVPWGFNSFKKAIPNWLFRKLFLKSIVFKELRKISNFYSKRKIYFLNHHFSHAASAYYPSPFNEAIVLTLDGVGEWATSTVSIAKNNKLETLKEINFPSSLGLLYSAFTAYTGFKVLSGEYKLMGLAPFGRPIYSEIIKKI